MQNPYHGYHFQVDWGGTRIGFAEVSGLDIFVEAVDFREGSSPVDSSRKLPGLMKFNNITLKRAIVANDQEFFAWINTKRNNVIERRDVVIKLLDADHAPVVTWQVHNAFPVRYSGPVLKAGDGGVAMEELELAHDGLRVSM